MATTERHFRLLYTGVALSEQENEKESIIDFIKIEKPILTDPRLSGDEKLVLSLIKYYNDGEGKKGLCASVFAISLNLGMSELKVHRILNNLYKMKRIMYVRKSLNSPERRIYLYDYRTVINHKRGNFKGTQYEYLDYYE